MTTEQVGAKLQALLDDTVRKDKLIHHAVLGVAHGDSDFAWSGAAGNADATGRKMQPDTPYFIASITKMYTSAAVLILQERGNLHLDDKLSKHLPGELIQGLHRLKGTDYTPQLTIRHLVTMTSGIADFSLDRPKHGKGYLERLWTDGDLEFTREEVFGLVREKLTPKFPPALPDRNNGPHLRGKAHYSDTNYQLLGAIIESAADRPLYAIFDDFFFRPLQMTQTYLHGYPCVHAPGEPAAIFYRDQALKRDRALKCATSSGGLVSSVSDSLRFMKALAQGELFARKETFAMMQQQWNPLYFPFQYSYGLMRFKMSRLFSPFAPSPELVGHSGSTGSFLYYSKELNLYLAGTVNQVVRQRAPFPLMLKAADIFRRASQQNAKMQPVHS